MPSPVLGARDTTVNKINQSLAALVEVRAGEEGN